ncbi:MAG: MgtC/SapB family protein [Myxococcota bacterium]
MSWLDALNVARVDLLGELVIATLLGGLIGLEREVSGKPAGLRTNILICVGATLITDLSVDMARLIADNARADASRLAAQIVSGIGFLGAGTIIQSRGNVTGLTSAATLWVVAAIGIAVGSRHIVEAVGTCFLVLVVLLPLGAVERRLEHGRSGRRLILELSREVGSVEEFIQIARDHGLTLRSEHLDVEGEVLRVRLDMVGPPAAWAACRKALSLRTDVRSMRVA